MDRQAPHYGRRQSSLAVCPTGTKEKLFVSLDRTASEEAELFQKLKFVSVAGERCLLLVPSSVRDPTQDEFLCEVGSGSLASSY
jgi:hypothetical protein